MKILCKQKIKRSAAAMKELQMVLECIGSSEFKWITDKIKSLPEKAQRRKQKVSYLPVAFPSLTCVEGCLEVGSIGDTDHLEPTGIVQFDLDLQDNLERLLPGQDIMSDLKAEIGSLPGLVYLFESPSGGLKFGIKTDFERGDGEAFNDMSRRFALVYDRLSQKISSEFDVELDGSMANIKQAMFLSYDPDYVYNPNPEMIFINDWSHSELKNNLEEKTRCQPSINHIYSSEFAQQVLSFIPQHLAYVEATSINYAFLSIYGESGVEILANHWVGESKTDVDKLKYFFGGNVNNPIGVLINAARKYACDEDRFALNQLINNSSGIRKQRPVPVDIELPDLLTPEEGKQELERTIEGFFNSCNNVYLKASGGLGKTDAVLKYIGNLPDDKKVLFLVKTYQNAEEIVCRFKDVFGDKKRISVAQGKVRSCKNEDIKRQYSDNGMPLPSYECLYNCAVKDQCGYILSRRHDDQIRVMTHEEYYVSQSIWAHGYTLDSSEARSQFKDVRGLKPKLLGWKPDFVVVDEDHFKPDFCEVSALDHWRSPGTIIHGMRNGLSLGEAINASIEDLTEDLMELWGLSRRKIVFTHRRQYISALKHHAAQLKGKELIKCLEQIMNGNTDDLSRISVDLEANSLTLHRMKQPAVRYKNVPTLFLDATANEVVVRSQLSNVTFKEIFVKKSPSIRTMMYSNINFSRQKMKNYSSLDKVIKVVKPHIKDPNTTHIITYKTVGNYNSFHHTLADALNIPQENAGYFGNERGLNFFENTQSLFIIGRQWLPSDVYKGFFKAIFAEEPDEKRINVDRVVRMASNEHQSLRSPTYIDPKYQAVHEHFSQSETVQAFLRGRLIYGSPKEIIFFGSNPLGHEIEIDEILFSDAHFGLIDYIQPLKAKGFVKIKLNDLQIYGVTKHYFSKFKDDVCRVLQTYGGDIRTVTLKGKNGRTNVWDFAIFDYDLFQRYLEENHFDLDSCLPIERHENSLVE